MPDERNVSSGPCIEPEVLAAYVDGKLTPDERAAVDAHLAVCGDCYALMTDAIRTSDDMDGRVSAFDPAFERVNKGASNVARPVFGGRRRWFAAAGALAVAAALLIATRPAWLPGLGGGSEVADLAEAIGTSRTYDGRLAGEFQYASRRPLTRSGQPGEENLSLLAVAAELQRNLQRDPSAANLHAFGVAQLLLGKYDDAIEYLSRASDADTRADYTSDLALAYLERGRNAGSADDFPKALAAAERAVRVDPGSLPAWFNRAAVIEAFGISDASRQAWDAYLARDTTSPWAQEARERRARLKPQADALKRWNEERERYLTSTASVEQAALLVELNPQACRELLEDELWPRWATAALPVDVERWGARASLLAERLVDRTHDRLVAVVQSQLAAGQPLRLKDAFNAWTAAKALYASNRMVDMTAAFSAVADRFDEARNPLASWARHYELVGLFYQGELARAEAMGKRLMQQSGASGYTALYPRVEWDLGTLFYQQARFEEAIEHYRRAGAGFESIGEFENATAINQLIGEGLARLGDSPGSWSFLRRALAQYDLLRDPRRRHTLLAGAGHTALNLGIGEAALPFFQAAIPNALAWNAPVAVLESYLNQARAQVVLHDSQAALETINQAKPWLERVSDQAMSDRFGADLSVAEAEVLLERDPRTGLAAAEGALAKYQASGLEYRLSTLHLLRGRLQLRLGDSSAAEQAFADGVRILESKRARVTQRALRISFLDTVWSLYDEMVALQIHNNHPDDALLWSERGRARTLLDAIGDDSLRAPDLNAVTAALAPDQAVLYLHATANELLAWVLTSTARDVTKRAVSRTELAEIVEQYQRALDRGGDDRAPAGRLFDVLLRDARLEQRGIHRLLVVPHGLLQFVPFGGLWDSQRGRYVVQDYAVTVLPSLGMFASLQSTPVAQPHSVSILQSSLAASQRAGLAPLAGVRRETEDIKTFYADSRSVDPNASTEAALVQALQTADVVHFGGHAIPDPAYPWHARLVLSEDPEEGRAYLVSDLPKAVRANVVVLAACGTARGAPSWGEGMTSLVTPFLQAGVHAVIATLADVEDDSMRALSTEFHRRLAQGSSPGDALRQAQLATLAESRDARAWAPVIAYAAR